MKKLKRFLLLFFIVQVILFGGERISAETKMIRSFSERMDVPVVAVEILKGEEEIEKSLSVIKTRAFVSAEEVLTLLFKWDLSAVNMNTAGVYKVRGT